MQHTDILNLALYEQECYEFTKVLDAFKSNLGIQDSNMQKIDSFAESTKGKEDELKKDIDAETNRAIAAENKIINELADEVNRATTKENSILSDLNNETERAKNAEASLKNTIDTNKPNWDDKYTKAEINNKFAMLENQIDWKESVDTFADIATTYPNPQDGWTVNVKDTDYTYRWNGTKWVAISANAIPQATEAISGIVKVDKQLSTASENPVQNKIVANELNFMKDEYGNLIFIGTQAEYETANNKGLIKSGTVVHITDDYADDTIIIDEELSSVSKNPVENRVVKAALDDKLPLSGGSISGNLTVTGTTALNNTLAVAGVSTFNDNIVGKKNSSIAGNETIGGTLGVIGAVELNDTLKVAKTATVGSLTSKGSISGTGMALSGNINFNMFSSTQIPFKVYGGGANGQGISVGAGAATIVGGGESAKVCESLLPETTKELWLTSDGAVKFYTNCQTIGNKVGVVLDESRNLYPDANNTGSIGTVNYKWKNMYATTFHGSLDGTATISTKLGTSNVGSSSQPVYLNAGAATAIGTLSVEHGGTGTTTFSSGAALIGNGTSALQTRAITNMTAKSYIVYNTNLMTTNTLAYWNGAYASNGTSNLTYCNQGAFGSIVTKSENDYLYSTGGTVSGNLTVTGTIVGTMKGNAATATTASKLDSSAGSATQPVYFSSGKPVACTYTLGKSVPSNAVFTDTDTWRGIQNNLTSTSTTDSLSAYQGKLLNDKINNSVFVGTKAEYETRKSNLINGAVVVLTDD